MVGQGLRKSPTGPFELVDGANVAWYSRGTGATLRDLVTRDQDVVYVTDFMSEAEQADAFAATMLFDHQPAIQRAIDYAMYNNSLGRSGGPRVRMPGGVLRIDRPVQVGYGVDFRSLKFEGEGKRYGGNNANAGAGTALMKTFNDAPGVVVQGGRYVLLQGFSIFGLNEPRISSITASPTMANLLPATWVDPSFPASASSRYAPECGIAIDPYCGARPGVSYPDVIYPSFLGSVPQYGKEASTGVTIRDVLIQGCVVGIAQQPCDADGNGDFTKLEDVEIYFCAYGMAWGNTQSRVVVFDNCNFNVVHTGIATTVFGLQSGQPQAAFNGCSFNAMIRILNVPNLNYGCGPRFVDCFAEGIYSIGIVGQAADVAGAVDFEDCEFGFGWWSQYGIPVYVYQNNGQSLTSFKHCLFFLSGFANPVIDVSDCWGSLGFEGFGVGGSTEAAQLYEFEGCTWVYASQPTQLWQKCALNATQGLSFRGLSCGVSSFKANRVGHRWNLDSGADLGVAMFGDNNFGQRDRCLPTYGSRAKGLMFGPDPGVPNLWRDNGISTAGPVVATGRNIVFNDAGYGLGHLMQSGGLVGDVIQSQTTRAIFWIYAKTGTQISARAMTGFGSDGNLLTPLPDAEPFSTLNCRRYSPGPNAVLYGDITSGSPDITNVILGTQGAPDIPALVSVGDIIFTSDEYDRIIDIFSGAAIIASIDNVAKTITMSGNFTRTQTRLRLGVFARPGMPNGTPT